MSEPVKTQQQQLPLYVHFISGGLAGTVGAAITCPLELVKTRYQPQIAASNPVVFIGRQVSDTFKAVQEGLVSLWKGVGATLVGVMPSRAIYFAAYNHGKRMFTQWNEGHESSLVHLMSASSAGIITATSCNPIWVVKTRIQLQETPLEISKGVKLPIKYKNSVDCVKVILREEGIQAFYSGLSASYLGAIESTLQFVIYEKLKRSLNDGSASTSLSYSQYFGCAAISKFIACVLTYPHEVLRTRLRQGKTNSSGQPLPQYKGLVDATRVIYRTEGMSAFYGGMTAHLLRVVPNSAIMFFCYELFIKVYTDLYL